jgi:thiosulfate dehydrogenase [quinone] large subunit
MATKKKQSGITAAYVWGITRISLGLIFLWAFFDKLWGLGYATCTNPKTGDVSKFCDNAWINGGSPTSGFLNSATKGPFADFFQSLAGNAFVDWLFMLGLLGLGLALVLGIFMRLATVLASVLLLLMYLAVIPPKNHPFIDDHIIYIFVLMGLWLVNDDQKIGMGSKWAKTDLAKRFPILK